MPYRFEPYASESGETNSESDSEDDNPPDDRQIPLDLQRLNNVEWCTCGCCRADNLETVQECVCCRELAKVQALNGNHEGSCITQHPGFEAVCLNEYVLDVAYSYYKQNHGHLNKSPHERRRYTAYRQLVRWCWGYLGKQIRVPLPACVVVKIRDTFPSPDYQGFQEPQPEPDEPN
ncbi:hypothetical protein JOQ06_024078 [Pogonophryne albipinna]|uniref:P2X purinoreceptor 7 intracellular domain-containing protein n=1 Tax=Pogonophryne albipinna TaxID=1090488 RepID=A0AAD6BHP6_9TELE|nr:hypothetical protein JOQ06_012685 [Pogonophryne albipinna]KAJ4946411.1 hypothetical protein JOQ06_024078 [Pogonophryne albipinna]